MVLCMGLALHMTKLYGYDRNDDGIMLNKMIYWEHPIVLSKYLRKLLENKKMSNIQYICKCLSQLKSNTK